MRRTGTVELDRREAQLLGNLSVLDLASLLKRKALDALSHVAAASDGRAAAEGLELDVGDDPVLVHSDLEFHHVSTPAHCRQQRQRRR